MRPATVDEALDLLQSLGAPARLVRHHELVAEAAGQFVRAIPSALLAGVDVPRVLVGAAMHDAGKIRHPSEMSGPGSHHEQDGRDLLTAAGVSPEVARCCVTHGDWRSPEAETEDLLVALADALWKGVRRRDLEEAALERLLAGRDRWTSFADVDGAFEAVADRAEERLRRSRVS